ncbi:MAG: CoA-binding protein [Syntrophothermus sp.]
MQIVYQDQIEKFLKSKRIAVVGISRKQQSYSRNLYIALKSRNYDLIPVNPLAEEIDGEKCCRSISDISPKPDAVLLVTKNIPAAELLDECSRSGIRNLWIYNKIEDKELENGLIRQAGQAGINLITGYCPIMFLSNSEFFHRLHGFGLKLTGKYPKARILT